MAGELAPRRIAVAVHPIREVYEQLPRKAEMQRILDNPVYHTTFGLNIYGDEYTLYITPKHEILTPREIPMRERGLPPGMPGIVEPRVKTIEPGDFVEHVATAEAISITLMGGEVAELDKGMPGCVFAAYRDIVDWFTTPGNGTQANELTIELPFEALYTMHETPFRYQDPRVLAAFRRQFSRPDLQELVIEEDRAVFRIQR